MNESELKQILTNLRWGTGMPIITMTAAGMEQVRCRGSFSLQVKDFKKLQEKLPEVERTSAWASSLIVTKVTDSIAEIAGGLTSARQLISKADEISKSVNSSIKTGFEEAGLVMTNFSIDAIDKM